MPTVSVVLPTYNRAPVLGRAIRSVLAQTYSDLELIVVDDASDDRTEEVVADFDDPRLVYLRQERRSGVGRARNTGIRAAGASLIAFQDSDDEWLIDKLSRQVAAMREAGDDTGLVCGGYIVLAANGRVRYIRPTDRMQHGDWGADNIFDFRFIAPTWLVRLDTIERAGLFDETLPNLEDWELAFRLYRHCRIVALDRPLLVKHGSTDGLNANMPSRGRSLAVIAERHGDLWTDHPRVLAKLYRSRGHCLCSIGDVQAGRDSLRQALRLDPQSFRCWLQWLASWGGHRAYRRLSRLPV